MYFYTTFANSTILSFPPLLVHRFRAAARGARVSSHNTCVARGASHFGLVASWTIRRWVFASTRCFLRGEFCCPFDPCHSWVNGPQSTKCEGPASKNAGGSRSHSVPTSRKSTQSSEIVEYYVPFKYKYPVVALPRFLSPSAILVVFHPH